MVDKPSIVRSHLGSVLGYLADASGGILANVQIRVPEALEDVGEDLGLHHHLGKIHGVLRDLAQAAAYLSFGGFKSRAYAARQKKNVGLCVQE